MNSRSLVGKQVVVAGGSSGLGFYLASEAIMRGASVTILGRDSTRLAGAIAQLSQVAVAALPVGDRIPPNAIAVDVMNIKDNEEVRQWLSSHKVDMLINCIGRSDRGALDKVPMADFEALFQENVLTAVSTIQCFLPSLEEARGCIINIGSLAGLIATPNMGAYSATKFALTALSRQWRLELEPRGVHVMLVSPGPIQRADSFSRYNELAEARGLQSSRATSPGGGAKLTLLDPVRLAKTILDNAEKRTAELVVPSKAKWLAAIVPLSAWLADRVLRKFLKK